MSRARSLRLALAGGALAAGAALAGEASAEAARFAADVAWLAADARDGRGAGENGLADAGAWIETRLATLGMAPAGDGGGYRQELEVSARLTCRPDSSHAPPVRVRVFNVVGRLEPAAPPRDDRLVVLGAHYDHLGCGAGARGGRLVFPGADDNASGVAALLEAARLLASRRERLERPVVFVFFTAEETGRLGSNRFVRQPPGTLERRQMLALVNLDMVGRLGKGRLLVGGEERASGWAGEVARACAGAGIGCASLGDGSPISDHIPFLLAGVPAILLTTGTSAEHHRPEDVATLVDAAGGARIAELVAGLAVELAARSEPLAPRRATPR